MTQALDAATLASLQHLSAEKRMDYLFAEMNNQQQIWILTDEHGCVMLNSDDEDCVPVWPHQECAQAWATGDWADCKAVSISMKDWQKKWLSGLEQDELAIAVFPTPENDDALVLMPDEFAAEFHQKKAR